MSEDRPGLNEFDSLDYPPEHISPNSALGARTLERERAELSAIASRMRGPKTLKVTIREAKLKRSYRILGSIRPFCRLEIAGQRFETVPDNWGGKNPKWTEANFIATSVTDNCEINLRLLDKQVIGRPNHIAWAKTCIPPELWVTGELVKWYPLSGQLGDGEEGEINISLSFTEAPDESSHIRLPPLWDRIPAGKTHLSVIVNSSSTEYRAVVARLNQPTLRIKSIQRIQNPRLYRQYRQYLNDVDLSDRHRQTPAVCNERRLYHGTDGKNVLAINTGNFNRSFGGQHGQMYGNGVYFARDPSYSIHSFCPPDKNGYKYLYQARVITGWFAIGSQGLNVPPDLPVQTGAKYDSVVDKIPMPEVFVVFHDAQAYPEYLITLKCDNVHKLNHVK